MSDHDQIQAPAAERPDMGPPATHCGEPSPNPAITGEIRYGGATPPPCSTNVHGEIEKLPSGAEATHWFVEANGVTWHFVTAGDPAHPPVIFLHGLPESWYSWHHQISALSDDYYAIALDQMGYGQSDKRLNLDYTNPAMAAKLTALLDKIGVERFHLVGHDRGSVTADHLTAVDGMQERILHYVRMQQSANEPHGEPRPPHAVFATEAGIAMFKSEMAAVWPFKAASGFVAADLADEEVERITYEFHYEGVAEAVSKYFQTTNFDVELAERHDKLFKTMSMPVLFLQGKHDKGQHPEEYANTAEFVANGKVRFVDAGHFLHLEKPDEVAKAIREFLSE